MFLVDSKNFNIVNIAFQRLGAFKKILFIKKHKIARF